MAHNIPALRTALILLRTGSTVADAITIISDAFEVDGNAVVTLAVNCIRRAGIGA
jgi:S-methylmethionine-dependent homocysteine/selenocysteine methylase